MKKLILLLCIPFVGIAQTDYELVFNSTTQDYVEMPNASSLIVNSTTFSMTGWVNPHANTTAHSGIMGFRNNIDADFYLLKLQNSNNVEARFRNSSGTSFDILANNLLDFNQWQHLAFSYDGSNIHLYKNGVLISSTPANGVITQMSQSFNLGTLDWNGTGFYMNGSLDEIRLWDITLSQNTISNWMCTPIDLTHPNYSNLMGYWKLNDGNGTLVSDASPNSLDGTLYNATWNLSTSCFGSTIIPLTYVPDNNFEAYLEINGMGNGIPYDDSVFTSAIDTVTFLDVSMGAGTATGIFDLTGIEDFTALTDLRCYNNQLTSLDLSQNTALTYLDCSSNLLMSLDLRNGNNTALDIYTQNNPNLFCIDVDDPVWSTANWTVANGTIDPQHYFSNNCSSVVFDCTDSLEVTDVIINNTNLTMNIAIYNGYNSYLSMPYVAFTIDANGDTIQQGNMNLFGAINLDTSWYNYSINSAINPSYPLTMYFVYAVSIGGSVTDTCILTYNSTPTAITDINPSSNRKLISIIDVLGRESKGTRNEPFFYIYDDGTVEKKIIIE